MIFIHTKKKDNFDTLYITFYVTLYITLYVTLLLSTRPFGSRCVDLLGQRMEIVAIWCLVYECEYDFQSYTM